MLSAHTIQRTRGLGAALSLWNHTWLAGKKNVVPVMRRLIKSSGPRARSRADTHVRIHARAYRLTRRSWTRMHALIRTYTRRASSILGLLAVPRRTVSQRSSSAPYHAALLCYSLFLSPPSSLSLTSRSLLHLALRIFIFVSVHRDTIRTANRGVETVHSFIEPTAMQRGDVGHRIARGSTEVAVRSR